MGGGVLLNKYLTKSNQSKNKRLTTDAFQLATSRFVSKSYPNVWYNPNSTDETFEIDFMKEILHFGMRRFS